MELEFARRVTRDCALWTVTRGCGESTLELRRVIWDLRLWLWHVDTGLCDAATVLLLRR